MMPLECETGECGWKKSHRSDKTTQREQRAGEIKDGAGTHVSDGFIML
jgi:hypothetical protein